VRIKSEQYSVHLSSGSNSAQFTIDRSKPGPDEQCQPHGNDQGGPEPLSQTEVIVVILQKNMRFNCASIIYVTARCSNGKAVPTLGIT